MKAIGLLFSALLACAPQGEVSVPSPTGMEVRVENRAWSRARVYWFLGQGGPHTRLGQVEAVSNATFHIRHLPLNYITFHITFFADPRTWTSEQVVPEVCLLLQIYEGLPLSYVRPCE